MRIVSSIICFVQYLIRCLLLLNKYFFAGVLYQSSGGLKKVGIGGAVGLGLAAVFVACTSKDKIRDKYGYV